MKALHAPESALKQVAHTYPITLAHTARHSIDQQAVQVQLVDDRLEINKVGTVDLSGSPRKRRRGGQYHDAMSTFNDPEDCKVFLVYPTHVDAMVRPEYACCTYIHCADWRVCCVDDNAHVSY